MAKTRIQIDRTTENAKRGKFLNSDKLDDMSLSMKEICDLLSQKNKNFDSKETSYKLSNMLKHMIDYYMGILVHTVFL